MKCRERLRNGIPAEVAIESEITTPAVLITS
jgi:hypothetical protein